MEYYVYLALISVIYLAVCAAVWRKTRSMAFMAGALFLYYWSLFGAWNIITSLRTGEDTPYLFYKVFPVFLDNDYRNSLLLYGLFITTVMATVLIVARSGNSTQRARPLIVISHSKAVLAAALCGGLGFLIIRSGMQGGDLGYSNAREAPGYSLFQVLNHGATSIAAIGLASFMSGSNARFITGQRNLPALAGYGGVLGGLMFLMLRTGNRSETVITFVLLALFYVANSMKLNRALLVVVGGAGLAVVTIVKLVRDNVIDASTNGGLAGLLSQTKSEIFQSTETVAAHLSMYGALHKHIPLTWGSSFVSLLASVVPRSMWNDRPDTVYEYYAHQVAAVEGQGYTIHHATGWYLNFGVLGLVAGAVFIGSLWAYFFNLTVDGKPRTSAFATAFAATAFWTFTSGIPDLLRAGPEVYKTTVFSQLLMPALLVTACSASLVLRNQRPTLIFRRKSPRRPVRVFLPVGTPMELAAQEKTQ